MSGDGSGMYESEAAARRRYGLRGADAFALSDGELDALGRAFEVGEWRSWRRTPQGTANESFFVEAAAGSYVVRRSNPRKTVAGLRFEVRLLDHLVAAGYPAPRVVRAAGGEVYAVHDGTLYFMTALLPGTAYDPGNAAHLRAAGAGLARYHNLVEAFPGPLSVPTSVLAGLGERGAVTLATVLQLSSALLPDGESAELEDLAGTLLDELGRLSAEMEGVFALAPKLLIHGSYGRSALLFDGDVLSGVVDYDRVRLDAVGMDFAYALKAFSRVLDPGSPGHRVAIDPSPAAAFVAAYRTVRPLPADEMEALPLFFRAQRLAKVVGKCQNLLTKHALVPQTQKDLQKISLMARREVVRLRWLAAHTPLLAQACR
jgi:homoserine kinase type II